MATGIWNQGDLPEGSLNDVIRALRDKENLVEGLQQQLMLEKERYLSCQTDTAVEREKAHQFHEAVSARLKHLLDAEAAENLHTQQELRLEKEHAEDQLRQEQQRTMELKSSYEKALGDALKFRGDNEQNSREVAVLRERVHSVQAAYLELQESLKASDHVRSKMQEELDDRDQIIERLKLEVRDSLLKHRQDAEIHKRSFDKHSLEVAAITRTSEEHLRESEVLRERVLRLEESVKEKEMRVEKFELEAHHEKRRREELARAKEDEISDLRRELSDKGGQVARLGEIVRGLEEQLEGRSKSEVTVRGEIASLRQIAADATHEKDLMQHQLAQKLAYAAKLEAEVASLGAQLDETKTDLRGARTECKELQGELTALHSRLDGEKLSGVALRKEIDELKSRAATAASAHAVELRARTGRAAVLVASFARRLLDERAALRRVAFTCAQRPTIVEKEVIIEKEVPAPPPERPPTPEPPPAPPTPPPEEEKEAKTTMLEVLQAQVLLLQQQLTQHSLTHLAHPVAPAVPAAPPPAPAPVEPVFSEAAPQPQSDREVEVTTTIRRIGDAAVDATASLVATLEEHIRSFAGHFAGAAPTRVVLEQAPTGGGLAVRLRFQEVPGCDLTEVQRRLDGSRRGFTGGLMAVLNSAPALADGPPFEAGPLALTVRGSPPPSRPPDSPSTPSSSDEPPGAIVVRRASSATPQMQAAALRGSVRSMSRRSSVASAPDGQAGQDSSSGEKSASQASYRSEKQWVARKKSLVEAQSEVERLGALLGGVAAKWGGKTELTALFSGWLTVWYREKHHRLLRLQAGEATVNLELGDRLAQTEDEEAPHVAWSRRLVVELRHRWSLYFAGVIQKVQVAAGADQSQAAPKLVDFLEVAKQHFGRLLHADLFLYQKVRVTAGEVPSPSAEPDCAEELLRLPFYVRPIKTRATQRLVARAGPRGDTLKMACPEDLTERQAWLEHCVDALEEQFPLSASPAGPLPEYLLQVARCRALATAGVNSPTIRDALETLMVDALTVYMSTWRRPPAAAPVAQPGVGRREPLLVRPGKR